jgi:molybdopterin synthase sulfur carrier subunit
MRFRFSGTLLRFTDYQKEIELDAATLRSAVAALVLAQPSLKNVIYDGQGNVRATHRLFLNGQQLFAADFDKPLAATDVVDVLTAIAGG